MIEAFFGFFALSWVPWALSALLVLGALADLAAFPAPPAAGDRGSRRGARGDRVGARPERVPRPLPEPHRGARRQRHHRRQLARVRRDPDRGARSRRRARRDAAAGALFRRAHPGPGRGQSPPLLGGAQLPGRAGPAVHVRRPGRGALLRQRRGRGGERAGGAGRAARSARRGDLQVRDLDRRPRRVDRLFLAREEPGCIASASASSACAPRSTSAWSRSPRNGSASSSSTSSRAMARCCGGSAAACMSRSPRRSRSGSRPS